MYRLVASSFLDHRRHRDDGSGSPVVVAVTGYRTYPDGNAQDQADDIMASLDILKQKGIIDNDGTTKVTLMGHSSGAHVSSIALLSNAEFRASIDCFVGLAGVYDIPSHYQYERLRGVERLSPMAVACGGCDIDPWIGATCA